MSKTSFTFLLIFLLHDNVIFQKFDCSSLNNIETALNDVIDELIKSEVMSAQAFEWLAHMRYYQSGPSLVVKMVNTERKYGFEYLGN